MKKMVLVFLLVFTTLLQCITSFASINARNQASNTIYKTMYVVNCKESITLRTSPSTKAAEIRQIPLGAPVTYVETAANGFYKVIYNGDTGYALASYLNESAYNSYTNSGNASGYSGGYTSSSLPYGTSLQVVNCKESISHRESASTSAPALLQIPLNAIVKYYDVAENGFYYISYAGVAGYALADYLRPTESQRYIGAFMRVVNCKQSITLRTAPSTSASEICQMPLNESVYVIATAPNGFYQVQYYGNVGYALSKYLQY